MSYIHDPGLIYSGLCPFTETEHSEPKIDDYGLDTMTRSYVGANALLDDFLATWNAADGTPLLRADYQYPKMYATGKPSVGRGRGFSTVSIEFRGKVSGAEPLVSVKGSVSENTVQAVGTNTDPDPDVSFPIIIDYLAGGTSYEYYLPDGDSELDAPRYSGGASLKAITISTIATGTDGIINTATPHGLSAGDYIVFASVPATVVPDINDVNIVKAVTDSDTFTIETEITTGGSGGTVTLLSDVFQILRVRGSVTVSDVVYQATTAALTFDQQLTEYSQEKIGLWWKCSERWEWRVAPPMT